MPRDKKLRNFEQYRAFCNMKWHGKMKGRYQILYILVHKSIDFRDLRGTLGARLAGPRCCRKRSPSCACSCFESATSLSTCAASDTRRCADTSFGGLSEIQKENEMREFMGMGPVEKWDETHISRRVREVALTVQDS